MKRSMTLIETLLAMTLFSLLFSTLFCWYAHFSKSSQNPPSFKERYCIERLNTIFSATTICSNRGLTTFHSSGDSLVFTFENAPCSEPSLSSVVLARLYLDPHSNALCLTLWPLPKEGKIEVSPSLTLPLLDNVHSLSFGFYYPKDPFAPPVSPKEIQPTLPQYGWQPNWKPEYHALPALMKITLNNKTEYLFDFPYPIIYPGEAAV